jgi:hypothetical protein
MNNKHYQHHDKQNNADPPEKGLIFHPHPSESSAVAQDKYFLHLQKGGASADNLQEIIMP